MKINLLRVIIIIIDQIAFGQNYGTAEATRIMYGQSQARKRVVLFLTVFVTSGLFSK